MNVAASAVIERQPAVRPARFGLAVLAFAAAMGGAEAASRFAGTYWGALGFAGVFVAVIQLAMLMYRRTEATDHRAALLAVASLIPLERLLVLSVPALPFLRLYPSALWVLPMIFVAGYAYRARWLSGQRPRLLISPAGHHWRAPAIQAGVAVTGGALGAAASFVVPYAGSHVLIYPDPAKWSGAVLFALAGGAEELAWRGILQPLAAELSGYAGIAACYLASAYLAVTWMGLGAALPLIVMTAVSSVVVYRTRDLSGSLAAHVMLNLLFVILR